MKKKKTASAARLPPTRFLRRLQPLPCISPSTHHKVRVQNPKLDGLDALDGRRRVREAVHRRHDCKEELCRRLCLSPLSEAAALSLFSSAHARTRRQRDTLLPRGKGAGAARGEREREVPFFPFAFLPFRRLHWALFKVNRERRGNRDTHNKRGKKKKKKKKHPSARCDTAKELCFALFLLAGPYYLLLLSAPEEKRLKREELESRSHRRRICNRFFFSCFVAVDPFLLSTSSPTTSSEVSK